jgi:hypothetical protein
MEFIMPQDKYSDGVFRESKGINYQGRTFGAGIELKTPDKILEVGHSSSECGNEVSFFAETKGNTKIGRVVEVDAFDDNCTPGAIRIYTLQNKKQGNYMQVKSKAVAESVHEMYRRVALDGVLTQDEAKKIDNLRIFIAEAAANGGGIDVQETAKITNYANKIATIKR